MRSRSCMSALMWTAATAAVLPRQDGQSIEFKDCPDEVTEQPLFPHETAMQCGFLDVPLDWDCPSGDDTVTLGIGRLQARKPEERIGNLFFNPGGPGELLTRTLPLLEWPDEIRDRFDIIGVDLRGSGLSEPVNCSRDLFNKYTTLDQYMTDDESYDEMIDLNQAFRQSCIDRSGPIVNYMDTASIAKDHEAVRKALGDEKLTFLGESYGTQLASQYAELFPHNIRGMVLDASYSISQSLTSIFVESASATDAVMGRFFEWCEQQDNYSCPLAHRNDTDKSPKEIWLDLLDRVEETPLTCSASFCNSTNITTTTAKNIRDLALSYLYEKTFTWQLLAQSISEAAFENSTETFYPRVITNDNYTTRYVVSSAYANIIISALDWSGKAVSSPEDMQRKKLLAQAQTPLLEGTSSVWANVPRILGWPQSDRNPPHPIDIPQTPDLPTILMVSSLYDPSTPYAMSQQLHEEIGWNRSVLTTTRRAGHTVYFSTDASGGPTVKAMNRYFLDLELPEQGTVFES